MVNLLSQLKRWLHSNSPVLAYFTISCHYDLIFGLIFNKLNEDQLCTGRFSANFFGPGHRVLLEYLLCATSLNSVQ